MACKSWLVETPELGLPPTLALGVRRGFETASKEKGIDTEQLVKSGSVTEIIIGAAQEENVDLIAMASHGRSGIPRVFYGSVAAGVLNQVDRPLLLIRSRLA